MPFSANALTMRNVTSCALACIAPHANAPAASTRFLLRCLQGLRITAPPLPVIPGTLLDMSGAFTGMALAERVAQRGRNWTRRRPAARKGKRSFHGVGAMRFTASSIQGPALVLGAAPPVSLGLPVF